MSSAHPTSVPRPDAAVPWERVEGVRRRVDAVLRDLPPGFVVVRSIQLPAPSRAVVQHLVVGPRGVWSVSTHTVAEPIAVGHGRNADTLFTGRRPLRPELEAADWEAEALSREIGYPVEPLVVFSAPSMPGPVLDFHGIRICDPASVATQVTASTADFVDVREVAAAVERRFGIAVTESQPAPTLGSAVLPPPLRPESRRRRIRRRLATRRRRGWRMAAWVAAVAAVLAVIGVQAVRSTARDAIDEAATLVGQEDLLTGDETPPSDVRPVFATIACPMPGNGWRIVVQWPGPPPAGVDGYGLRVQSGSDAPANYTPDPWSDPTDPPGPIAVTWSGATTVFTDHLADGEIVATAAAVLTPPAGSC